MRSALILIALAAGVHAAGAQTRAFTGALIIDGTDQAPILVGTILVRDGKVVAVGKSVQVPAGAERIALDGKVVIPGLVSSHGHVSSVNDLRLYAQYGVTTVFSLGSEPPEVFAARDAQNVPTLDRARVFAAGRVLSPRNPEEARAQVAENLANHSDVIKIRVDDNLGTTQKMTPEVYRAVIDEAHKRGARAYVHLFYLADAKGVLDAGADFIAHSVRDADVDADVIAKLKARNVCLTPTLMREVSTFVYESTPEWFSDPLFTVHANPQWVAQMKEPARQDAMKNSASAQRYKLALVQASTNLKMLVDAGVMVAMGTDTGPVGRFQGYFELMELDLMAKAGLTPQQVLRAATRDAARCMKIDAQVGTLEAGKWADFVVLDANPLSSISNVRKISAVYVAGNRVAR